MLQKPIEEELQLADICQHLVPITASALDHLQLMLLLKTAVQLAHKMSVESNPYRFQDPDFI